MEVVIAEVLFIVSAVISGIQKGWALCAFAAAFAVLYAEQALNQF
jgi:hypothetical protein